MAFVDIASSEVQTGSRESDLKNLKDALGETLMVDGFVEYTREFDGQKSKGMVLLCGSEAYSTSSRRVMNSMRVIASKVDYITEMTSKGNPKTRFYKSVPVIVRTEPVVLRDRSTVMAYKVSADLSAV